MMFINDNATSNLFRLKDISIIMTGNTPSKEKVEYYGGKHNFYKPSDMVGDVLYSSEDSLTDLGALYGREAPTGSTLVCCIGATLGKAIYLGKTGCFNQQINAVIPSNRVNSKYLYFQLITTRFQDELKSNASYTTLPIINANKFSLLTIYLPPLEEQRAIAEYLDRETVRIDRIVELLTKQRERYAQLKRSLISEVVTHGLPHHNYTMKEANLPWLDTIPEHWEVRRIKDILSSVFSGDWGDEPIENNSYVCVRIADFDNRTGKVVFKDTPTYRSYPINSIDSKQIHNGDILLEKSGGGELVPVARVVLWDRAKEYSPCLCANFIQVLRTKRNEVIPMYLMHLLTILHTMDIVRLHIKQTTGIQNLSLNTYLSQSLPLPPLEEQQEIVAYLDERCKRLDRLVEAIDRKIDLLGSLKKSLIEEVVTGQRRITN
ncbi:restriction endonuclease subunit S [Porphyromonas levii]|uniref:restriction endonuclease subunit S n=1 Tax=Porphyromonas levii TaxID=28114 RepID=UPI001B8D5644|nr:restriction endonuclease subunit S [Porphyromonas levii]MBR8769707.1 hypothetical protein [Porphyromonas levii]